MRIFVLFLIFLVGFQAYRIKDSFIVDDDGLKRVYHGVNVIYKIAPFYPPIQDRFDANDSLSDEDLQNLVNWGMTMIRLYVSWEGFEAVKGQYDFAYLQNIKDIVDRCAKFQITVLLDAHQDALSRFFCGEGLPDWAITRSDNMFPFPLKNKFDLDERGYPLIEQCLKTKFFAYYFSFDASNTLQAMFDNKDGIADSFAQFWGQVANFFKDSPNVIGYEIINEPLSGSVYHSVMEFIYPNRGNDKNLLPLYQKVHQQIRLYDDEKLIFFEPGTSDLIGARFSDSPGGINYRDREIYSYHIYCPFVDAHSVPTNDVGCKVFDRLIFGSKEGAAKALGVGKMLTEFGAISDSPKGNKELNFLLALTESAFTSWAYWEFKYFADITTQTNPGNIESFYDQEGQLYTEKVKTLARPYATAICGTPIQTSFDPNGNNHFFALNWNASSQCNGKRTQVFLSEEFYYQKKIVSFKNCVGCKLIKVSHCYYEVELPSDFIEDSQVILHIIEQ